MGIIDWLGEHWEALSVLLVLLLIFGELYNLRIRLDRLIQIERSRNG